MLNNLNAVNGRSTNEATINKKLKDIQESLSELQSQVDSLSTVVNTENVNTTSLEVSGLADISSANVINLDASHLDVDDIEATSITAENVSAQEVDAESITGTSITVEETATAKNINVSNKVTAKSVETDSLTINDDLALIGNFTADNINSNDITSADASITNITATNILATNVTAPTIEASLIKNDTTEVSIGQIVDVNTDIKAKNLDVEDIRANSLAASTSIAAAKTMTDELVVSKVYGYKTLSITHDQSQNIAITIDKTVNGIITIISDNVTVTLYKTLLQPFVAYSQTGIYTSFSMDSNGNCRIIINGSVDQYIKVQAITTEDIFDSNLIQFTVDDVDFDFIQNTFPRQKGIYFAGTGGTDQWFEFDGTIQAAKYVVDKIVYVDLQANTLEINRIFVPDVYDVGAIDAISSYTDGNPGDYLHVSKVDVGPEGNKIHYAEYEAPETTVVTDENNDHLITKSAIRTYDGTILDSGDNAQYPISQLADNTEVHGHLDVDDKATIDSLEVINEATFDEGLSISDGDIDFKNTHIESAPVPAITYTRVGCGPITITDPENEFYTYNGSALGSKYFTVYSNENYRSSTKVYPTQSVLYPYYFGNYLLANDTISSSFKPDDDVTAVLSTRYDAIINFEDVTSHSITVYFAGFDPTFENNEYFNVTTSTPSSSTNRYTVSSRFETVFGSISNYSFTRRSDLDTTLYGDTAYIWETSVTLNAGTDKSYWPYNITSESNDSLVEGLRFSDVNTPTDVVPLVNAKADYAGHSDTATTATYAEKDVDGNSIKTTYIKVDEKGAANGVATLDRNGKLPASQLPVKDMTFEGMWDASTNTPTLADGTGTQGDFYIVSVAGTQDLGSGSINFNVNDRVIYDGAVWVQLKAGTVDSVNGVLPQNGNVTVYATDIALSDSDPTTVEQAIAAAIGQATWSGTISQYNAIVNKNPATLYIITDL